MPPCTRRNVVYENVCTKCHPEAAEGKEVKEGNCQVPAIYVGESCRSLAERGKEHWAALKAEKEDSHMWKHHVAHHKGQGEVKFHLRPIKYFKTALSRQVSEAVRIKRRGGRTISLTAKGSSTDVKSRDWLWSRTNQPLWRRKVWS